MQEVNCRAYLMRNLFGASLGDCKISIIKIREEVAALKQFNDDVNIVLVLKYVIEPDDAWVLADLEHFDLSLQQF